MPGDREDEENLAKVVVPTDDGDGGKAGSGKENDNGKGQRKGRGKGKGKEDAEEDMSQEDRKLRDDLTTMVGSVVDAGLTFDVRREAVRQMTDTIRTSTTSMTSIPKPLKFLRPFYRSLKAAREGLPAGAAGGLRAPLEDMLSVLAMTMGQEGRCEALSFFMFRFDAGDDAMDTDVDMGFWGHEYTRHIAGELSYEWNRRNGAEAVSIEVPILSEDGDDNGDAAAAAAGGNDDDAKMDVDEGDKAGADDEQKKQEEQERKKKEQEEQEAKLRAEAEQGNEEAKAALEKLEKRRKRTRRVFVESLVAGRSNDELMRVVRLLTPFFMQHSAETDAVDLLLEVGALPDIVDLVSADDTNFQRICLYVSTCSDYVADVAERTVMLNVVARIYFRCGQLPNALRFALKLRDDSLVTEVFASCKDDEAMRNQLGFIMGSHRYTAPENDEFEDDDDLLEVIGNVHLSQHFHNLARELDVQEAKVPEDIYKTHLAEAGARLEGPSSSSSSRVVDSAKMNLASTFVNAFVNLGFGTDKLVTPDGADWLYKNKGHGMMSAAASVGTVLLWDLETGFTAVDKYSYSEDENVKAGALLATGIVSSGVTSEMDAALALLQEHAEDESSTTASRVGAAMGLGLAYAGTAREEVLEPLVPLVVDGNMPDAVVSTAALALGLVYVGTGNDEVLGTLLEVVVERVIVEALSDSLARSFALALGLVVLGIGGESSLPALEALAAVEHPSGGLMRVTLEACAYAGTGNPMAVQSLLAQCVESFNEENQKKEKKDGDDSSNGNGDGDGDEDDAISDEELERRRQHQAVAVLGIALVTMGEDIGSQMARRSMDHLLQYGEVNVRRAVPLALALLSVSNPDMAVMDTLSKLSHDQDELVSQNAVLALGFIGAGTNNSRIANLLRQLAVYYAKENNHLFLVKIAQGVLHLGKGLMTLDPMHSERELLNPVALGGLFTVMFSALDMKSTILADRHYLLYSLVCSARPRMLVTVDEELEPVAVKVKVGQAVDVVGQAGQPKKLTGFQSHSTPVLLSYGEKAELATDEYLALTNVLEGFVIVRKNPDYKPETSE